MNSDDVSSIFFAIVAVIYVIASLISAKNRHKDRQKTGHKGGAQPKQASNRVPAEPKETRASHMPPPLPVSVAERAVRRKTDQSYEFHSQLEGFQQKTSIEDRHLDIHLKSSEELVSESLRLFHTEGVRGLKQKESPIRLLIENLPQKKLLFLSYEVFGKPVSRRQGPFPWNS